MFSEKLCDSLPPCTLSLLDTLLQLPFAMSEEVFNELLEDIHILSTNCWRIITRANLSTVENEDKEDKEDPQVSVDKLFIPILTLVCRECCRESPFTIKALWLLRVMIILIPYR